MMNASKKDAADYSPAVLPNPVTPGLSSSQRLVPDACSGQRFDVVLATLFPEHSRSRLQTWIKDGLALLDGEPSEVKQKVWGGEAVELLLPESAATSDCLPEALTFPIVFEDGQILVVDKPAGLVVHPGNGNWSGTLQNGLLHHDPALAALPRAGIVHRLDKDTSGLMVVAKTLEAQTHLVRQLQARTVKRHYLALVLGQLTGQGLVDQPLGRHPTQRTKMAVVRNGREAHTHYAVEERFPTCTLVECRLDTGRTHQIRVHMAHLGHPLVGDPVYGRRKSGSPLLDAFPRQALHARQLGLIHPATGAAMVWESPLPDDFDQLLMALRKGP
ncbi:MAG: 23S rRNA pseudouridine(1911/1915/1917) synthase RluD [Rhodocyclaceae bacterium]|nr:MAG: 23S rRNA pseudouridine(1911/1915/1917) synthase RluD [Rhodocyclaceae bacterium]